MHIFGVVVWLGGLMFQHAIAQPVVNFESLDAKNAMRNINRRFTGFIWMSVWTVFITGFIMMLLNPRFLWFRYDDRWSMLLGLKQLVFVVMIFYAFGHARMLALLDASGATAEEEEHIRLSVTRANQFRKVSIFLGITAMLMATAMA